MPDFELNLYGIAYENAMRVCAIKNINLKEYIRRSISLYNFFVEEQLNGHKLAIVDSNNKIVSILTGEAVS